MNHYPPVSVSSGRNLGDKLFPYINDNVIGRNSVFQSKFGQRKVVYCDYTASGRSLQFIEDFLQQHVMPLYANTHTTTGVTSRQSTYYLQEARDIIRNAVNASPKDSVLFAGNGSTGAINKLVNCLCETWKDTTHPPLAITGPFEHHSVILPFREAGFEVVRVGQAADGSVDMAELRKILEAQPSDRHIIGCFSAASNVTGQLVDTTALSVCLHEHGALACFDFATAAPYVKIDMNPVVENSASQHLAHKDAIFISPHKFVGGVDSPGVLVAKSSLFSRHSPSASGGGSVLFVSQSTHSYLSETELREEAGTSNIIACVRAGLAFQLKEAVGSAAIMEREVELLRRARSMLSSHPNVVVLGDVTEERLAIFSFLIRHPDTGRFLHYNFVSTLLNDLFGIQTRGGCMCAGPYALDLLGLKESVALEIYQHLEEDDGLDQLHLRRYHFYSKRGVLRPGFTRFNLPYFMSDSEVNFVLEAIRMVAEHGWKLLPQYRFDIHSGEWKHHQDPIQRRWLGSISYASGKLTSPLTSDLLSTDCTPTMQESLSLAAEIFDTAASSLESCVAADQRLVLPEDAERLRWYVLPSEVLPSAAAKNQASPDIPVKPTQLPVTVQTTPAHGSGQSTGSSSQEHSSSTDVPTSSSAVTAHVFSRSVDGIPAATGENSADDQVTKSCRDCCPQLSTGAIVSWPPARRRLQSLAASAASSSGHGSDAPISAVTHRPSQSNAVDTSNTPVSSSRNKVQKDEVCRLSPAAARSIPMPVTGKPKFVSPPKNIFKPVQKAIDEFSMIVDGDRVLVALSGGKDSLSLLHTLHQYQFLAKRKGITFQLGAVTIDPQTEAYDPSPLKAYLAALGVPYFYEEQGILAKATELGEECTSICSFCSRMKRGRLYSAMRREGYNVLAMGQHLDDLAESFMMSCFHNGLLRTMKANYTVENGDLRVIRPLVYVREESLRHFAEQAQLPVISENCPACFEAPKERHRVKRLLAEQEVIFPQLYHSLQTALHPLMSRNACGMESKRPLLDAVHRDSDGDNG